MLSPSTPKLPYEVWILPLDHDVDFAAATDDEGLVRALQVAYAGVDRAFDGYPFNSWLHRIPRADFHWHFEVQPRVGMVASLELGGDMYINAVSPAVSAARWRSRPAGD